jgi:drug/metabolite transporter (DMT)-like permease
MNIDPIVAAAGQLLMSSLIMILLATAFDAPSQLIESSARVWIVVGLMAVFSTALAYILYFRLLASAGATNAILVTLLIPVTAILLGALILDERLLWMHFLGMTVIGLGLSVIDGRLWQRIIPGV